MLYGSCEVRRAIEALMLSVAQRQLGILVADSRDFYFDKGLHLAVQPRG